MARIRDFDDPAEEDYERVLSEQRDREERDDRLGRDEPLRMEIGLTQHLGVCEIWTNAFSDEGVMQQVYPAPQED